VDKAESDETTARAVNAMAPGILGEEAAKIGALVIHYSTDYVFDGTKSEAYVETDPTNPLSVYGRTKLDGERALAASGAHHLIFRTSWVYGLHGSNFIKTILRLAREREELRIVADQFGAPTGAPLIADITAQVLRQFSRSTDREAFPRGVFHLTADGITSWHGFARHCVETANRLGYQLKATSENIHAIPATAYPLPAARPSNSSLNCRRLSESFGFCAPDWSLGVEQCMESLLSGHQAV
jgi:dTDP-4-dehydrorhamnose reductase